MKKETKVIAAAGAVGAGVALALWAFTRKAEANPENITLGNLSIYPGEVYVGDPVSISVLATNIGGVESAREIICEVGGKMMKKAVSLNPGESKQVSFSYTPNTAREYFVSVNGLSGSFEAVEEHVGPLFQVTAMSIEPFAVYVGETVTISVTVTNIGDEAGSHDVVCEVE